MNNKNVRISYDLQIEPKNLDPQYANDYESLLVINNIFDGLFYINTDGQIVNDVVDTYDLSKDKLTYTFKLKETKWEDGSPVLADDFLYSFKRLFSSQIKSIYSENYLNIKNAKNVYDGKAKVDALGVKVLDSYTLQITLEKPDENFLYLLTLPAAFPCNEAFFNKVQGKYGKDHLSILANGELKVNTWFYNDYLKLITNGNHYKKSEANTTVLLWTRDDLMPVSNFLNEKTQAVFINLHDAKENELQVPFIFNNKMYSIIFNNKLDKNIRKAICLAYSNSILHGVLEENLTKSNFIVPSDSMIANKLYRKNTNVTPLKTDLKNAKKIINAYLKGVGESILSNIKIIINKDDKINHQLYFNKFSQAIQQHLKIFIGAELLPEDEYNSKLSNGDFDMAIVEHKLENASPFSVLSKFMTNNKDNYGRFSNKEFDNYLNQANNTNSNNSLDYFENAEEILLNSYSIIPLYSMGTGFLSGNGVSNIIYNKYTGLIDFTKALPE